jgi:glycosyltransferase involved in cell wall biosynthesis
VLIDSFQKVLRHHAGVQLHIIGPERPLARDFFVALSEDPRIGELLPFCTGSYLSQLQLRIDSAWRAQVTFTGRLAHTDLVRSLRESDLHVHPAVWDEPFAYTVLESMAVGLPVIASRAGGPAEYIEHGSTGWLVEPGDVDSLAEAIITLLSDDATRERIGRAARARAVDRFSWDRIAEDMWCCYQELCGQGTSCPSESTPSSTGVRH